MYAIFKIYNGNRQQSVSIRKGGQLEFGKAKISQSPILNLFVMISSRAFTVKLYENSCKGELFPPPESHSAPVGSIKSIPEYVFRFVPNYVL